MNFLTVTHFLHLPPVVVATDSLAEERRKLEATRQELARAVEKALPELRR